MSFPIRVVIQQPALPKYRIPVFRELGSRPGIALRVVYADTPGLSNVPPEGFEALHAPMQQRKIGGRPVWWHSEQLKYASPQHADVLILSWSLNYLSLLPALFKARLLGVRTILWGHGYSKHEAAWRHWARQKVAKLADALLFYNHTTAKQYIEQYGWNPSRVFVALNSLDQSPIQAARESWLQRPEALKQFRQEHGLEGRPTVLFVSRLEVDNRVDQLLKASHRLLERFPELRTVIIGKGPDLERLKRMSGDLGLKDHVIFTGAIYDERELAPWFISSDVFCYPENIGLSILHAFGYGLPVVTSDKIESQNPEIEALRPGENGRVYRHGDVGALADTLAEILSARALRDRLSDGALRTVLEQFTLKRMVDGFEDAVNHCVGRRRVHRPGPPADVAMIANANAPYRTHFHRRLAREVPEIRLWSFFTHENSDAPWKLGPVEEIRPLLFGAGESVLHQNDPGYVLHEWRKGRKIIQELIQRQVRAVVMLGYNDPGRLRVIRWCRHAGIPCFMWGDSNIRGDHPTGLKRWIKRWFLKRLLERMTGVFYCGSLGEAYFRRYGLKSGQGFLCTLEPDYGLIESADPARAMAKWTLKPDRRRIVYSGRLVAVKRVDLLIKAFIAIAEARPQWDLIVAGDGMLKDPLMGMVPSPLRDRVIWTGFVNDQAELAALYRASDVLVLPSDFEPWALVINEAAAAGLAIVASDVVGAAAELVRDGVNGRIFPKGDLAALSQGLLDVTDLTRIEAMKAASGPILAQWRQIADPVEGFRKAMRFCGVLPPLAAQTTEAPALAVS